MRILRMVSILNLILFTLLINPKTVDAKVDLSDVTKKTAETQIRHILEPLLDKYCHDECKLMNVSVTVDLATAEEVAPGFDEIASSKSNDLAPSSARVKILMDDKVGPVSRRKLLDLVQQYLDTLDYPTKVDTQIAHFPQPQGTETKIAALREKVSKQFLATIDDLLKQFCPQHCLLADFDLQTEVVNGEEAQYGSPGEFIQDGDTAIKIKDLAATLLMDDSLSAEEQSNILQMAKLKTNNLKHVSLASKTLKFPRPVAIDERGGSAGRNGRGLASDSKSSSSQDSKSNSESKLNSESRMNSESKLNSEQKNNSTNSSTSNSNNSENNVKQEKFERIEKIERVESGDAVQAELQKFKVFGLIFACSILALLLFIAVAGFRNITGGASTSTIQRVFQDLTTDPTATTASATSSTTSAAAPSDTGPYSLAKRYEIERLTEELSSVYAQQPKVAKQVFSRVLTEEGVETTAECIHIFGEGIVIDMLRDPSLQTDVTELMEFYAKNPITMDDDEKLDLLRKLHSRTVAGKLVVLGNRSSNLFDFLAEMDGLQILELIRTESLTVKSIVLTQCDPQKRSAIYAQLDPDVRMKLLTELSRIDYLPRDFIFNVATALKRKKRDNPKLNTEALPGSEVLVSLLERTGQDMQKTVMKNLEVMSPDSARTVKSKLVSTDTLRFLRDGQLLEVVLSLKHDELLQFLKGAPDDVRKTIFSKSPKELVLELEEELTQVSALSREAYQSVERKILNRMKIMANEGQINLVETNERMFSDNPNDTGFVQAGPGSENTTSDLTRNGSINKVSGW